MVSMINNIYNRYDYIMHEDLKYEDQNFIKKNYP